MRQAVILAGGRGMRMRPATDDRPKAMVEVAGAPILEHQLRWLAENDVTSVAVSCGYRAEVVEEFVAGRQGSGLDVVTVLEEEPLGRGGGLRLAAGRLPRPAEAFLALNGDVITRCRVEELIAQHERLGAAATLVLVRFRTPWAVAELDGDRILHFEQSPLLPYWGNSGVYWLEPEVRSLLPARGDLEETTFPALARQGRLGAYRFSGYLRCMDSPKDVAEVSAELMGLQETANTGAVRRLGDPARSAGA